MVFQLLRRLHLCRRRFRGLPLLPRHNHFLEHNIRPQRVLRTTCDLLTTMHEHTLLKYEDPSELRFDIEPPFLVGCVEPRGSAFKSIAVVQI